MKIERVKNTETPYELLFLADEDDDQIAKYYDKALFWVAMEDDKKVGVLGLVENEDFSSEIVNVAVDPLYENRKIGRSLVEKALEHCKKEGLREVWIKTGNCGIKQIYLYQRCGFRLHSINRDYFSQFYSQPMYENFLPCADQVVLQYRIYSEEECNEAIKNYWQEFIKEHPQYAEKTYEAWPFGFGFSLADELLSLVRMGKKTATCSAREVYDEDEPFPEAGGLSIILKGNGMPGCIIETKEVRHKAFREITAEEAAMEGEGDLSLDYWQKGHKWFFGIEYAEKGLTFTEEIPVLFEIFKVVYNKEYK